MQDFNTLRSIGDSINEHNDCAVIAVAAATGTPYETVHDLMKKFGRRTRGRTKFNIIEKTLSYLGFKIRKANIFSLIQTYDPGYKNITMNHFAMYPSIYSGYTWLAFVSGGGHVAAVVNGKVEDWSDGRKMRVAYLYSVEKA